MDLCKGKKSSEFLVAVLIIAPWFCNSMGIDLQQLAPFLSAIMGIDLSPAMVEAGQIRETIEAANRQTNAPVWVGFAYIVSRPILKVAAGYFIKSKGIAINDNPAT